MPDLNRLKYSRLAFFFAFSVIFSVGFSVGFSVDFFGACSVVFFGASSSLSVVESAWADSGVAPNGPVPALGTTHAPDLLPSQPSLIASGPMTAAEAKEQLKDFQKAQKTELRAFDKSQESSYKELKSTLAAEYDTWFRSETEKRHAFQATHPNGGKMRDYIHDFEVRLKEIKDNSASKLATRKANDRSALQQLKDGQKVRLQQFEAALKEGHRPDASLWPQR